MSRTHNAETGRRLGLGAGEVSDCFVGEGSFLFVLLLVRTPNTSSSKQEHFNVHSTALLPTGTALHSTGLRSGFHCSRPLTEVESYLGVPFGV